MVICRRSEVKDVVDSICKNHNLLKLITPSYVAKLAFTVMKMDIRDDEIWFSLADYLAKHHTQFDLRGTSTYLMALHHASKYSPITMDFSEEFTMLELPIIQKLEDSNGDHASLTQIVSTYSKAQLGSVEFFSALEKFIQAYLEESQDGPSAKISEDALIIQNENSKPREFKAIEVANLMYSYASNENCSNDILDDLTPVMAAKIPGLKSNEMK